MVKPFRTPKKLPPPPEGFPPLPQTDAVPEGFESTERVVVEIYTAGQYDQHAWISKHIDFSALLTLYRGNEIVGWVGESGAFWPARGNPGNDAFKESARMISSDLEYLKKNIFKAIQAYKSLPHLVDGPIASWTEVL